MIYEMLTGLTGRGPASSNCSNQRRIGKNRAYVAMSEYTPMRRFRSRNAAMAATRQTKLAVAVMALPQALMLTGRTLHLSAGGCGAMM